MSKPEIIEVGGRAFYLRNEHTADLVNDYVTAARRYREALGDQLDVLEVASESSNAFWRLVFAYPTDGGEPVTPEWIREHLNERLAAQVFALLDEIDFQGFWKELAADVPVGKEESNSKK